MRCAPPPSGSIGIRQQERIIPMSRTQPRRSRNTVATSAMDATGMGKPSSVSVCTMLLTIVALDATGSTRSGSG